MRNVIWTPLFEISIGSLCGYVFQIPAKLDVQYLAFNSFINSTKSPFFFILFGYNTIYSM